MNLEVLMKKIIILTVCISISFIHLIAVYHKIGNYNTPGSAVFLTVNNGIAYIADGIEELQIIDVNDPENPVLLQNYCTNNAVHYVKILENIAYVVNL